MGHATGTLKSGSNGEEDRWKSVFPRRMRADPKEYGRVSNPFGASLVDQTSLSELHERAGDPGRREPPTGGAWSSGMYTCMSESIPISIHAVCVVISPYTTCFRRVRQCRRWYEPPCPSSHPN